MDKRWLSLLILIVIGIGIAALFVPTPYQHVLTYGTDTYRTHARLFDDRSAVQEITLKRPATGIGVLLANLRSAEDPSSIELNVTDQNEEQITEIEISGSRIEDDTFVWTLFDSPLPADIPLTLTFTATKATVDTALGIRYDEETEELAIGIEEEIPAWQQVQRWSQKNKEVSKTVVDMLIFAAIATVIVVMFSIKKVSSWKWTLPLSIAAIATWAIIIRIPDAQAIHSTFGGDAFNYVLKSWLWITGEDPLSGQVRRAPLLSLLLLPSLTGIIDIVTWGRIINIISAASIACITPFLLIKLRIPKPIALLAGLLIASNRLLWWESLHPLANTPYAALTVAATLAFLFYDTYKGQYLIGILSGLATLMRYEGGLIAAAFVPLTWLYNRFNLKALKQSTLPAAILILILFVMWPVTGQLGIRPVDDIANDGGLPTATDFGELEYKFSRVGNVIGQAWILIPLTGEQFVHLFLGVCIGISIYALKRTARIKYWQYIHTAIPFIAAIILLVTVAHHDAGNLKTLSLIITAVTGIGIGYLWVTWPKRTTGIIVMLAIQILFITWIIAKERYYIFLMPYLAVAVAVGIYLLGSWQSKIGKVGISILLGSLIGLSLNTTTNAMPGAISEYNSKSHDYTVMLKTARYLQKQEGRVAVTAPDFLIVQSYVGPDRTVIFPHTDTLDQEQLEKFQEHNVSYVIETNAHPNFSVTETQSDQFKLIREFHQGSEVAKVFKTTY